MGPEFFMTDEQTAGMSVDEVPVILDLIEAIKSDGDKTILLVEHKMDVVRRLADRVIVLHNGALGADAAPTAAVASPIVQVADRRGRQGAPQPQLRSRTYAIRVWQVLAHQGGLPGAGMPLPPAAWEDHQLLRRLVCDFTLEWTPGSRVEYHRLAAHWVAAVLIEAVAKTDYRAFIRSRLIEPLGLSAELFLGLPDAGGKPAPGMPAPSGDRPPPVPFAPENRGAFP